jgi:hypothetical protein
MYEECSGSTDAQPGEGLAVGWFGSLTHVDATRMVVEKGKTAGQTTIQVVSAEGLPDGADEPSGA